MRTWQPTARIHAPRFPSSSYSTGCLRISMHKTGVVNPRPSKEGWTLQNNNNNNTHSRVRARALIEMSSAAAAAARDWRNRLSITIDFPPLLLPCATAVSSKCFISFLNVRFRGVRIDTLYDRKRRSKRETNKWVPTFPTCCCCHNNNLDNTINFLFFFFSLHGTIKRPSKVVHITVMLTRRECITRRE